jgi:hypothetical protein
MAGMSPVPAASTLSIRKTLRAVAVDELPFAKPAPGSVAAVSVNHLYLYEFNDGVPGTP